MKKIDAKLLTSEQLKKELKRTTYNNKYNLLLRSTIYILLIIAALGVLVGTFLTPVLEINTNSMQPLYKNGDIIVTIKTKKIKQGDMIAFYHGNKILISRVIGISSDWIDRDETGILKVNDIQINDEYAKNEKLIEDQNKYPIQVGSEEYFVLNDDREDLTDSRNKEVGMIKKEDIIGKILFKVWSSE